MKKLKKRKISIRSAKNKGKRFQNWIAEQFSSISGVQYGQDKDIESRQMGMSGVDIIFRGKAKKLFPFSVEAKNCERWSVHIWIDQAKKNKLKNTEWLLFVTKNRFDKVVVMDANYFFKILTKLIKEK